MADLLFKMAQQAHTDDSLLASLIEQQCERQGLTWDELAIRLRINQTQMAKLALCRKPRNDALTQDLEQIANYVGMEKAALAQFAKQAGYPVRVVQTEVTRRVKRPFPLAGVFKKMTRQRTIAFSLAAITIMIMAAFAFAQPTGPEATLVVSAGQAVVSQNRTSLLVINTENEVSLASGNALAVRAGDVINLPAESAAQLRLQDGSLVDLFADTTLEVSELITTDDSYRVQLNLLAGRTVNRVIRLLGADDRFNVRTPSSTASVRGTVFTVEVLSANSSYVGVEEGVVQVSMGSDVVDVRPGFEVTAVVGQPLTVQPLGQSDAVPADEPPPTETPEPSETPKPVTLCHIPPGNPDNPQTIQVSPEDVQDHLDHGDYLGPCEGTPEPTETAEPSETPTEEAEKVVICHIPGGNPANQHTIEVDASSVLDHLNHGDYLGECIPPTDTPVPPPPPPTDTPVPPPPPTDTPVPPPPEPELITICHYPPGNPENGQTIVISIDDWPAHQAHGDTMGACP